MEDDIEVPSRKDYDKKEYRLRKRIMKKINKNCNHARTTKITQKSVLTLILIRKYRISILNTQPKEIILMIAKFLWSTRQEKCWTECYKTYKYNQIYLVYREECESKRPNYNKNQNQSNRDANKSYGIRNRKELHFQNKKLYLANFNIEN